MAHTVRYDKNTNGRVKTDIKPFYGINSYSDPISIGDNMLSDAWEAMPNDLQDAVKLETIATNSIYGSNLTYTGLPVAAIGDLVYSGSTAYEHLIVIAMEYETGHNDVIDYLIDLNCTSNTKTVNNIASYALTYTGSLPITSMCLFFTEAKRYVCFTCMNNKTLLLYDYTTIQSVALPFYPKEIVSHANRIFAIDMVNKLWWCRAGDPFTWYGVEADDDRIVTSTNMLDSTAYTIAAQPDVPRPLTITVTAVSTLDTLGTLAFVGTDALDAAQTKTYTPISGVYTTPDVWKTVTSITATGHAAVSTVDTIKIGVAPVTGFVQADQGMWTLEQERTLCNLGVIGDSLYIWSDENIYVFQGYSYDTFSLTKVISGIGLGSDYTSSSDIAITHNVAYFQFRNDIYEFDGKEYPRVINRPVYVNGGVSNGIYGGIYSDEGRLLADSNYLYLNNGSQSQSIIDASNMMEQHYYYVFDIKARSWWKKAGLAETVSRSPSGLCNPKYYIRPFYGGVWAIAHLYTAGANNWYVRRYAGTTYAQKTYLFTKAFSSGVSEDNTLTQINILCRSYYGGGDLNVYYSNTSYQTPDDWVLLKTFDDTEITDDLQTLVAYTIGSEICRKHHFRLKLEYTSVNALEIYGIELRYRKLGRSR